MKRAFFGRHGDFRAGRQARVMRAVRRTPTANSPVQILKQI